MIPVLYHDKVPIRTPGETINAVLLSIFLKCKESPAHALETSTIINPFFKSCRDIESTCSVSCLTC